MAQHQLAFSSIEICTAPHFSLQKAPYLLPSPQLFFYFMEFTSPFSSAGKQSFLFISFPRHGSLSFLCVCVCNFVCVVQDKLREYLKYNVRVTYPGNLKIKQKKRQEKREQNGSFSSFFFVVVVVIVFFYAFNLLPIILLFTA